MAKVVRQMVEDAGLDVEELIGKWKRAAAAELTTYYYYTILRFHLIGLQGEGIKEIAEDARIEDRNHFEAIAPRIYELGGELYRDLRELHDDAACAAAYLPFTPVTGETLSEQEMSKRVRDILNILVEAERCAIRVYTDICNYTQGKDHRSYDLALAILHEEIEHEAWFSEFLGEGPSGHFRRAFPGESPYVSKFLTAAHGK